MEYLVNYSPYETTYNTIKYRGPLKTLANGIVLTHNPPSSIDEDSSPNTGDAVSRQYVQECGLASSRRSHDGDQLTWTKSPVHPMEDLFASCNNTRRF